MHDLGTSIWKSSNHLVRQDCSEYRRVVCAHIQGCAQKSDEHTSKWFAEGIKVPTKRDSSVKLG